MLSPLLLAAMLAGDAAPATPTAASPPFPAARSLVPYTEEGDVGCYWTMHDPGEKWIRGGIGQGDEEPVFHLVDHAFDAWSDSEEHRIEISAGDPTRRVSAKAWAGSGDDKMPGSVGFYMSPDMRRLIGGATSVQVWKDGKPVSNAVLAETPTAAELDACVRPFSEHSDQE
jgi:hypothetical protein